MEETNSIIRVENKQCFIDSESLADMADRDRRSVTRLIVNHKDAIESFGVLRFEITKPNELGGRPKTIYLLNEQQATLITTFMTNSKKVVDFKKKLVSEFFRMRDYIQKQEVIRLSGIEVRKSLTDTVKESGENDRMHGHGYSTYTKMVYEVCGLKGKYNFWKSKSGISTPFREELKPDELKRVELAESLIKPLLELDKQYHEIKDTLKPLFNVKRIEK